MTHFHLSRVLGLTLMLITPAALYAHAANGESLVKSIDQDHDSTLDLAETKAAAGAHFDKLEKDDDGTLDAKEVKGIIGPKAFKEADPDNDGTLTKDEYLKLVERLFKKLDLDNDGTLDAKELHTKTAAALRRLIS